MAYLDDGVKAMVVLDNMVTISESYIALLRTCANIASRAEYDRAMAAILTLQRCARTAMRRRVPSVHNTQASGVRCDRSKRNRRRRKHAI